MKKKCINKNRLLLILLLAALAAMLLCSSGMAYAEEDTSVDEELNQSIEEILENLDLSSLEDYYNSLNENEKGFFGTSIFEYIRKIITGEFEFEYSNFFSYILSAFGLSFASILPMLISIVAIAVLISIIGGLRGSFATDSVESVVTFAGIALCAVTVLLQVFSAVKDTIAMINSVKTQLECIFPILFTLMTAIGASSSVSIFQPAVAVLGVSVTELISVVVMPVILIIIVFSVIGNLSDTIKLKNMSKFFTSAAKWLLYTAFFLFIGFLSIQGVTAAIYDNISIRTTKFALSQYVPIIGGYLSEGFNIIAAGSVLIKNSVGLTSIILILVTVLPVLLNVISLSLGLKLSAALVEPFSNNKLTNMLSSVSTAVNMLISVIVGVLFVYFLFVILIICSGNLAV